MAGSSRGLSVGYYAVEVISLSDRQQRTRLGIFPFFSHTLPQPSYTLAPEPEQLDDLLMMMQTSGAVSSGVARGHAVRVAAYHHGHHNNGHNGPNYKDSRALRDLKTKQNKHILSTYNKAYALFPKVKFVLKHHSRLGEVWKLSGSTAELGNWMPELSPTLSWREGGVWSAEVALPPGHYSFKCMLRTADGSYIWEGGDNRTLTVPVKDRPGHFVMTYHMDVRHTEPVESVLGNSLSKQKGQEGVYSPMGDWNSNSQQQMLERAMSNGRVPANAW